MKKLKKMILLGLFCMISIGASAYDFEVDGIFYNITSTTELTCAVTCKSIFTSNSYTGAVNIPSIVTYEEKTYSVTGIDEFAFIKSLDLTSVTIPNTVISINHYAFMWCVSLASVTIPNSVTSIGDGIFQNCEGLSSVTMSDNVTSIGSLAFDGCKSLIAVTIPESVTSIGNGAFELCSGLTSVTIPKSVKNIGERVFYGCSGLTSMIVDVENKVYDSRDNSNAIIETATNTLIAGCQNTIIPNTVTSIGKEAFELCSGLTSVTIPKSVESIGEEVFYGCSGLTSIIVDAENKVYDSRNNSNAIIETATNTLITGCQNTIIPSSVTSIGKGAFYGCSGLTSIEIPSSVISIGESGFEGCRGLTSLEIPNTVTSLEKNVFRSCKGLISIEIPNSVISIGECAFAEDVNLTSVTIGNSVTSIGEGAFEDCRDLKSIEIPSSVTSIGNYAFSECDDLTSVTNLATTPQQIIDNVFEECGTLHVLKGYKDTYAAADVWKKFTIVDDAVDPTGIEEISLTPVLSTREGATYNLQGVKVNGIKKGEVFIHSGRKFIAR